MGRFAIATFLVCGAVLIELSVGLICKNCSIDCDQPEDEICLEPGETQNIACLRETFKDIHGNDLEERKCVIYQKDIPHYECPRHPNYTTTGCDTCFEDVCNNPPPIGSKKNATASQNEITSRLIRVITT